MVRKQKVKVAVMIVPQFTFLCFQVVIWQNQYHWVTQEMVSQCFVRLGLSEGSVPDDDAWPNVSSDICHHLS